MIGFSKFILAPMMKGGGCTCWSRYGRPRVCFQTKMNQSLLRSESKNHMASVFLFLCVTDRACFDTTTRKNSFDWTIGSYLFCKPLGQQNPGTRYYPTTILSTTIVQMTLMILLVLIAVDLLLLLLDSSFSWEQYLFKEHLLVFGTIDFCCWLFH